MDEASHGRPRNGRSVPVADPCVHRHFALLQPAPTLASPLSSFGSRRDERLSRRVPSSRRRRRLRRASLRRSLLTARQPVIPPLASAGDRGSSPGRASFVPVRADQHDQPAAGSSLRAHRFVHPRRRVDGLLRTGELAAAAPASGSAFFALGSRDEASTAHPPQRSGVASAISRRSVGRLLARRILAAASQPKQRQQQQRPRKSKGISSSPLFFFFLEDRKVCSHPIDFRSPRAAAAYL